MTEPGVGEPYTDEEIAALRDGPALGRVLSCYCGQPDDRERVHRAHECVPWVSGRSLSRSSGHCCFAGCDLTTCSLCGKSRCVRDFHTCPPSYLCNCGESFPSHLARVAHAATCPVMTPVDASTEGRGDAVVSTPTSGRFPSSDGTCQRGGEDLPCTCYSGPEFSEMTRTDLEAAAKRWRQRAIDAERKQP